MNSGEANQLSKRTPRCRARVGKNLHRFLGKSIFVLKATRLFLAPIGYEVQPQVNRTTLATRTDELCGNASLHRICTQFPRILLIIVTTDARTNVILNPEGEGNRPWT